MTETYDGQNLMDMIHGLHRDGAPAAYNDKIKWLGLAFLGLPTWTPLQIGTMLRMHARADVEAGEVSAATVAAYHAVAEWAEFPDAPGLELLGEGR